MPVDPDNMLASCEKKRIASDRSSDSSDLPLHMTSEKKRTRGQEPPTDHQAGTSGEGGRKIPTMGCDNSPSHQPAETEETTVTTWLLRVKNDLESLQKDMNEMLAEQRQSEQLFAEIFKARLDDTTRDLGGRKEELEIVVQAQGTKISELYAELAEVSTASKERIWELEVDLKSKEHRLKQASAEAEKLREEFAKLQSQDEDRSRDLAAECAFSACVNLIKGRYPQLDLSFCDLGAALKAQQQGKS